MAQGQRRIADHIPASAGRGSAFDRPEQIAPAFGADAAHFVVQTIRLTDAQTTFRHKVTGTFLWVLDASDLSANAEIRFNDQIGDGFTIKKGFYIGGLQFDQIFVSNTAQSGKTLTIVVGVERNAQGIRVVNPSVDNSSNAGSALVSTADVTLGAASADQIVAANTNRKEALITNISGAVIRVGDSAITATRGVRVDDGATIILDTNAAVFGYSAAGGDVAVLEVEI